MGVSTTDNEAAEFDQLEISVGSLTEILNKANDLLRQQREDREAGKINDRTDLEVGAMLILAIMYHYHELGIVAVQEGTLKWWHSVAMSVAMLARSCET